MSSLLLKITALISMTIDHIGAIFFPSIPFFRFIGRLAFPIYCFLLVEGYEHTKEDKKRLFSYLSKLLIFAILAEIPYNLALYNSIFYLKAQNVLFELALGLIALKVYDLFKNQHLLSIIYLLLIALFAFIFRLDGGFAGIILIIFFKLYKDNKKQIFAFLGLTQFLLIHIFVCILELEDCTINNIEKMLIEKAFLIGILFAFIFIIKYNEKKGYSSKFLQLFFYAYYPLHLILLYLISILISNNYLLS